MFLFDLSFTSDRKLYLYFQNVFVSSSVTSHYNIKDGGRWKCLRFRTAELSTLLIMRGRVEEAQLFETISGNIGTFPNYNCDTLTVFNNIIHNNAVLAHYTMSQCPCKFTNIEK